MSQTDPVGILYKSIYKQDPVSNQAAFDYWSGQYDGGMSLPKLGIEMRNAFKDNLTPWSSGPDTTGAKQSSGGLLGSTSLTPVSTSSTPKSSNQSGGLLSSAANGRSQANNYQESVKSMYQDLLGRDPGQAGLDFYVNKLQSGTSLDQLRQEIFGSDEAVQYRYNLGKSRGEQHSGGNSYADATPKTDSVADQLKVLYLSKLGRGADQAGLEYWTQYANEHGIEAAKQAFINSAEVRGYQSSVGTGGSNAGSGNDNQGPADQVPDSWYDPEADKNGQYGQVDTSNNAVVRQVNGNTDTVQGQLDTLLQEQNPLMQRAYYKGLDLANSRGLLNSSMASEAAMAAMMDAALPVAQQDAQTYYNQGTINQAAMNDFNLSERQMQHDMSMADREDETLGKTTSANLQGRYVDAIQDIIDNAAVSINEIETTAGMTQEEKDSMIQNTIARRDADLAFTRQLYSNMPTWDFSWLDMDEMPSAPGIDLPDTETEGAA